MEQLPNDILELIGRKLHQLYMIELKDEIYEECLEYEWRKENDDDDSDEDYYPSTDESEDDYEY